ncbi:MAG TPA: M23 family metallopeptidase [Bryobacteraceae bacterium]|nr:M23 family metallopeptidase [Bryobacteraceae bacterium]
MQKQDYFIVVLAHSLHGKLRRIQIPQTFVYGVLLLAVLGCFSIFGFVSSYARMAWKVANYNSLRKEADALRVRYEKLQKVMNQTNEQMASLQLFANEVSVAYGIKQKLEGPPGISAEGRLVPTFNESVEEYNYLRSLSLPAYQHNYARRFHTNVQPSLWPVEGRLLGPYGQRTDPFSGEGAYHTGVDISAPTGTVVRATADGIVAHADRLGGYGRLVVIDHGNGIQTYYAHLSRYFVVPGQEIRRGEPVGAVGSSGRVTAPHLHYEVRIGGAPVNPYRYLAKAGIVQMTKRDFPF